MITIISAIIGFLASLIPSLIKIWEKKQDYTNEYNLRKLELEAIEKGIDLQARIEQIKAASAQSKAVYQHDESITYNETLNDLRASVRPVVTYTLFGVFLLVKLIVIFMGVLGDMTAEQLIQVVWDEYTAGIFTLCVSYWFGTILTATGINQINNTKK